MRVVCSPAHLFELEKNNSVNGDRISSPRSGRMAGPKGKRNGNGLKGGKTLFFFFWTGDGEADLDCRTGNSGHVLDTPLRRSEKVERGIRPGADWRGKRVHVNR